MIKWYWIFISLSVGFSAGFCLTFFNIRRLLLTAIRKPGGSLRPPGNINKDTIKKVIEKVVKATIKDQDFKKTTNKIIEEMNNLPEYKP